MRGCRGCPWGLFSYTVDVDPGVRFLRARTAVENAQLQDVARSPVNINKEISAVLFTPSITIDKVGSMTGPAPAPQTVTYLFYVRNGSDPQLSQDDTALSNVSVADDKCGNPTYASGDTNGDNKLETSETWVFQGHADASGARDIHERRDGQRAEHLVQQARAGAEPARQLDRRPDRAADDPADDDPAGDHPARNHATRDHASVRRSARDDAVPALPRARLDGARRSAQHDPGPGPGPSRGRSPIASSGSRCPAAGSCRRARTPPASRRSASARRAPAGPRSAPVRAPPPASG